MSMNGPRGWYRFQAKANTPEVAELVIYDSIGGWDTLEGITAKAFLDELAKVPASVKTIICRINSPGGDVFAGLAIANALRAEREKGRRVETIVDGLAASAASLVLMAGQPARIAENGLVFIHNPWGAVVGGAEEIRGMAEALDKIRVSLLTTYQWKSKLSAAALGALMDGETWLEPDEARAKGFVDEILPGVQAAAGSFHPRALAALKVPEKYAARFAARAPEPRPAPRPGAAPIADVLRLCGAAGLDLDSAQALIAEGVSGAQLEGRISTEAAKVAADRELVANIAALCDKAKLPELAPEYMAARAPLKQVRSQLTTLTAKLDCIEIDTTLEPGAGGRRPKVVDVMAVYLERNKQGGGA